MTINLVNETQPLWHLHNADAGQRAEYEDIFTDTAQQFYERTPKHDVSVTENCFEFQPKKIWPEQSSANLDLQQLQRCNGGGGGVLAVQRLHHRP